MQKTILVTGGAGFVGANLIKRLVSDGNHVISLDVYFAGNKDTHVEGAEYREGHTKDIERLVPENIDLIYHLGEYARVEKSLSEPDVVWDLNVAGTFAVVEYWRKRSLLGHTCKLVYAGSSTKFGDSGLARDATPYAWMKATNTELVRNYGAWYKLPYAITYFYNVYGPGERTGRYGTVVAMFAEMASKGQPITVVSPGSQMRNFTHIDDIVEGLVLVGEKGEGDGYGLGAEQAYSILEVAKMFGDNITMLPERAGNRSSSGVNNTRSKELGWSSKHDLVDYVKSIRGKA